MRLIDQVRFLPRRLIADQRGWFLKVLDGGEEDLSGNVGEVYLTMAVPGQARGSTTTPLAPNGSPLSKGARGCWWPIRLAAIAANGRSTAKIRKRSTCPLDWPTCS